MNGEVLQSLVQKLARGDAEAAEQLFRRYEPYLRMVVRRQLSAPLRAKFDSMDIVQSIWVDVLDGFQQERWRFDDADHLRAFLVRVTRNRFVDRARQHQRAVAQQLDVSDNALQQMATAAPSETVTTRDLWERIMGLCSPQQREIVAMRRDGFSLDEIAARTGYHKSSIRRVLYELSRRLAEQA